MLDQQELVAFIGTQNPDRARQFYAETLGLTLLSEDAFALVFQAGGTKLRIQKLADLIVQPFTVLGWVVPDIELAVRSLALHELQFERFPGMNQDVNGVWAAPSGARVVWFKDPDGNVLSLTQL